MPELPFSRNAVLSFTLATSLLIQSANAEEEDVGARDVEVDYKAKVVEVLTDAVAKTVDGNPDRASLVNVVRRVRSLGYGVAPDTNSSASGRQLGNRGGRGGGGHHGGGSHHPMTPEQTRTRFDSLDRDGDGVWKGSEINRYMSTHPASADGTVTYEEYEGAWAQIRGGGGAMGGRGNRGGGNAGGGNRGGGSRGGRPSDQQATESKQDSAVMVSARGNRMAENAKSDAKMLVQLDHNRDRKLTSSEVAAAVEAISQDEDSSITIDDSRSLRRAMSLSVILHLTQKAKAPESIDREWLQQNWSNAKSFESLWEMLSGDDAKVSSASVYRRLMRSDLEALVAEAGASS